MSDEPLPDFIAMMDQARAQIVEMAKLMRDYHSALVASGFSEDQALALTMGFQTALVRTSGGAE